MFYMVHVQITIITRNDTGMEKQLNIIMYNKNIHLIFNNRRQPETELKLN